MEQKNNWNWLECIYKSNNLKNNNNFIQRSCIILPTEMETLTCQIYKIWICQVIKLQNFYNKADVGFKKNTYLSMAVQTFLFASSTETT